MTPKLNATGDNVRGAGSSGLLGGGPCRRWRYSSREIERNESIGGIFPLCLSCSFFSNKRKANELEKSNNSKRSSGSNLESAFCSLVNVDLCMCDHLYAQHIRGQPSGISHVQSWIYQWHSCIACHLGAVVSPCWLQLREPDSAC